MITREERKLFREFKDVYAKKQGWDSWDAYLVYCKGQGFDADEIGWDDLAIEYSKHVSYTSYLKGLVDGDEFR